MKAIAIITARGGSKRIPGKNTKDFCGKPIIAYSIQAAIASGVFDEVMVSTDSEEIAAIAREYGAQVPFTRSAETSNDFATTADVLVEVIENYKKMGMGFDCFCCLYPTAPFVTGNKLKAAMEKFLMADADSLLTVVRYGFPPQRAMVIREGFAVYEYPENAQRRSQDLEPIYHDCGQFYFCKTDLFLQGRTLILPKTVPMIMPEEEVQDIDTPSDWELAKAKYQTFIAQKK